MKVRFSIVILIVLLCSTTAVLAQDWPQWGLDPQHTGQSTVVGQSLDRNIVNIVYDNLVAEEMEAGEALVGEEALLAHFQAPLVDGNNVYMLRKTGTYSISDYSTQSWSETKFSWSGGTLVEAWNFASDWKAMANAFDMWEPVFHPALANGSLYVPGAGGTIFRVDKGTGAGTRINPFNSINDKTYTASPISVAPNGDLYYTVIRLQGGPSFFSHDVVDSWLVKVTPSNVVTKVSFSAITPGAPAGNAQCLNAFIEGTDPLPWPPSPTAVPGSVTCGSQRAAVNAAPAIAPDGTVYVISRAHLISRWGYLIAVNPNLTFKWISSLRERFNDGCGVSVAQGGFFPPNGTPGGCRAGANLGVDPATNAPGGGRVLDDSSSSPVVAPDGSVFYGAYSRYNYAQGHLMKFSSSGAYLGTYGFGWDITPGIYKHGATYSVLTKENRYGEVGSYCNTEEFCPSDRDANNPAYGEAYFITQLNKNLNVEWMYRNTNTLSCHRNPDDSVTCVDDHPKSFEWCVNAWVIDANGTSYVNSEDGNLFAIDQGGILRKKIFQQLALGAAYTPTSIGNDGKIYSQNAGHLFVAGF